MLLLLVWGLFSDNHWTALFVPFSGKKRLFSCQEIQDLNPVSVVKMTVLSVL